MAEQLKLYARGGPRPGTRTRQLLRRYDLATPAGIRAHKVIPALSEIHESEPGTESCYALAELSYIAARNAELHDAPRAQRHYWNSVVRSYEYLFDGRFERARNAYDPQFRGACDLYNNALEQFLRIARKQGNFRPGETLSIDTETSRLEISIVPQGFHWRPEDFDRFEFVSDYKVTGLKNLYRTHGLGVPLIAVRRQGASPPQVEKYYARGLSFPVTAFLRLERRRDLHGGKIACRLELHDPLENGEIAVAGRRVPLESDHSTPLAYFLNQPQFRHLDTIGLVRPDLLKQHAGLYMLQPYQPDKIPVVMIHGLWSSPMTWMEAFNDLRSNPEIRDNYQFWFYLYPTGQPYWITAADLRDDMDEARSVLAGPGPSKIDDLVLVGHSMGGLVARLLTLHSGNDVWNTISDTPIQLVKASDEAKREIDRVFFFEPNSSVSRVITIGSPHRGSELSNRLTQWLGRHLIRLPGMTLEAARQLFSRNPAIFRDRQPYTGVTSLDTLAPDSPILRVMQRIEPAAGVKYHNVVGIIKDAPLEENTDGVVAYSSAHLQNVDSEIVVQASHQQLHRHPRTVLEIERILLAHLDSVKTESYRGVVPAVKVFRPPAGVVVRFAPSKAAPAGFGHSGF